MSAYTCSACHQLKDASEFTGAKAIRRAYYCKTCRSAYNKAHYAAHGRPTDPYGRGK